MADLNPVAEVAEQQAFAAAGDDRHADGRRLPLADATAAIYVERPAQHFEGRRVLPLQLLDDRIAADELVLAAALRRAQAEQADVVQDRLPEGVVRVEGAVRVRDGEAGA